MALRSDGCRWSRGLDARFMMRRGRLCASPLASAPAIWNIALQGRAFGEGGHFDRVPAQSRSPDRRACRGRQMACAAAGRAVVSAMAAARSRAELFARSQRSGPDRVCALRRGQRHRGDARGHTSRGRSRRQALLDANAKNACARRQRARLAAVGSVRAYCRQERGDLKRPRTRSVPGLGQSRLLHDQDRALGDGGRRHRPVPYRHVPSTRSGRQVMAWLGLALLVLVGFGIIFTGLPAAVILVASATLGAILGIVSGTIEISTLGALPSRLVNLFENDLLQALPLYVTMGLLLDRLPVADALYRASNAALPRKPSAPLVSGMVLGALLGPMNGSVGASVLGLSRVVAPRLAAEGIPAPSRQAIVAVASTLGVLVPPSLVLILLSDAMLSANTVAVTQTGRSDRVINTQDIFHAALLPAGICFVVWVVIAWIVGSRIKRSHAAPSVNWQQGLLAGV